VTQAESSQKVTKEQILAVANRLLDVDDDNIYEVTKDIFIILGATWHDDAGNDLIEELKGEIAEGWAKLGLYSLEDIAHRHL